MSQKENWEAERTFGHYIVPQSKDERRCQIKAKIQCVLLRHWQLTTIDTVALAEEIMNEIEVQE